MTSAQAFYGLCDVELTSRVDHLHASDLRDFSGRDCQYVPSHEFRAAGSGRVDFNNSDGFKTDTITHEGMRAFLALAAWLP